MIAVTVEIDKIADHVNKTRIKASVSKAKENRQQNPNQGPRQQQGEGDWDARGGRNSRRRRGRNGRDEGPQGEDRFESRDDVSNEPISTEPVKVEGYLDLRDEGYGFLRIGGYMPTLEDAYIPVKLTRQFGLRKGDHVSGLSRPAGRNEKKPSNAGDLHNQRTRPREGTSPSSLRRSHCVVP
jgi:transcription termination factor Rho